MKKGKSAKGTVGVAPVKEVTVPHMEQASEVVVVEQSPNTLSPEEKKELASLEKIIDAKLGDFFDVGNSLMEIKAKGLFRETHKNFNGYCQARWGFGRSYANKLIGSAERIRLLPEGLPKPANEFQIRPFLKLDAEEFPGKWQTILDAAGPDKVTSKIVKKTLNLPAKKRKKREQKPMASKGEVGVILGNLRTALKAGDVEEALKQVVKLEKLIK